jgi:hypothetical protein
LFAAFAIEEAERSEAIVTPATQAPQTAAASTIRARVRDLMIVIP